jgi:hypothetical protein
MFSIALPYLSGFLSPSAGVVDLHVRARAGLILGVPHGRARAGLTSVFQPMEGSRCSPSSVGINARNGPAGLVSCTATALYRLPVLAEVLQRQRGVQDSFTSLDRLPSFTAFHASLPSALMRTGVGGDAPTLP